MTSLRSKLWFGVGGLLAILLVVGATSVAVLTSYKNGLEQLFRENYDSAIFCDSMKASLDHLSDHAQRLIWDRIDAPATSDINRFETALASQLRNVTLPGEGDLTGDVQKNWQDYKRIYARFAQTETDRQTLFRTELLPLQEKLRVLVQQISDMNMNNMVSVDGQVRRRLWQVRGIVFLLVGVGIILATTFTGIVAASILRSIRTLTRSANEIASGNLDLAASVGSRDEIGQLADAFNTMAGKLREFRKLDHERLVRTQHTTQLAIDSLPDAVFVIGPNSTIEISNRTAQKHFGAMPGVAVEQLHLPWLSQLYDRITRTLQPIDPADYKTAIQLFNGTANIGTSPTPERFLLPHAQPMLGDDGQLVGVTVILVDVTQLRHADELKSDLVSTVSHELRTPLTSIRMGTMLLAEESLGPLNDRQRKSIDAVREESDRLHRIIENLLSMSRIEAGRVQFHFRLMSPTEIMNQAVEPLRYAFADRKVNLAIDMSEHLPNVSADPNCIELALTNLLSNALKFTPLQGSVSLKVEQQNGSIRFTVTDTGPGIPTEHVNSIFEKFYRVPRKDGPTGAGLGLAIARDIVTAHGGRLYLESPLPTTFVFTLPVAGITADMANPVAG